MSTSRVQYETDGPLGFVTVNRPDARNATTWEVYEALVAARERADADEGLRAPIVRSTGDKAIISGTDFSQFTALSTPEGPIKYERHLDAVIDRLERVRVPTIAQIQGVGAGGGCAIAMACASAPPKPPYASRSHVPSAPASPPRTTPGRSTSSAQQRVPRIS